MKTIEFKDGFVFAIGMSASEIAAFCEKLRTAMDRGDTEMWTDVLILRPPPEPVVAVVEDCEEVVR